jgi:hypothetical protein
VDDYTLDSHRTISVEGHEKQLVITRNLFDALCALPESQYMWIDAVCINQENLDEKAVQLPLMGAIYSNAQHVAIWLGKDESGLEDVQWILGVIWPAVGEYITANGMHALDNAWSGEDFEKLALGSKMGYWWRPYSHAFEQVG